MTNKNSFSFEWAALENIRQKLIEHDDKARENQFGEQIKKLGEIMYELEKEIEDNE